MCKNCLRGDSNKFLLQVFSQEIKKNDRLFIVVSLPYLNIWKELTHAQMDTIQSYTLSQAFEQGSYR